MTNEEIKIAINEIVEEIQSQPFEGTAEEIKLQQILYFDKQENICQKIILKINYQNMLKIQI